MVFSRSLIGAGVALAAVLRHGTVGSYSGPVVGVAIAVSGLIVELASVQRRRKRTMQ